MKVKELKQLIAELPEELDEEEVWYVDVSGFFTTLHVSVDEDYGVGITGDTEGEVL